MKKFLFFIIAFTSVFQIKASAFEKVIIWGHKLHSHTHSYIHNAFYRAFKEMGYSTFWFDNSDELSNFDFSNSLFLTEGQADSRIPLREDCFYLVHNPSSTKYKSLKENQYLTFQVYTKDVLSRPTAKKIDTCIYTDLDNKCVYMPWATDLLPNEIEIYKKEAIKLFPKLGNLTSEKSIFWVGTIGGGCFGNIEEISPFQKACEENGITFIQKTGLSMKESEKFIRQSFIAPTIVGTWQKEKGYVPCRIFKNISYGKMGVTNSETIYELFEGKIVYNPNTYQLFYEAKEKLKSMKKQDLIEIMDIVKNKHTYINRIQLLLDFMKEVENNY